VAKVKIRAGAKTLSVDGVSPRLSKRGLMSVAVLEPLVEAEVLDISHNAIRSFAELPRLPKVHTLHAYGNPLRDLKGIERLPALKKLYVDAASPAGITRATSVDTLLLKTKAKDLRFLAGMKLSYLGLVAPLTSFAGIDKLPALGELVIHAAKLGKLAPLAHRTLWKLIISESGLTRVPALDTPALLLALVGDNAVASIGAIKAPVLRELDVSSNPLTHLEGLENLGGLEQLTVEGRRIKTIAKATDTKLRALGDKLVVRAAAKGGVTTYAAFSATRKIV
jgi:Leucine-rich repeat (LRR) protein